VSVPRNDNPEPDPLVALLDSFDVVSLVGYVGEGRTPSGYSQPSLRIHPDRNLQRWLEIPRDKVIHSQQIDSEDTLTRSIVWVDHSTMVEPILSEEDVDAVAAALEPAPLSTWNLIPNTRLVAANLLGLIWDEEDEEGGSWS
jgi:hypothetical protein